MADLLKVPLKVVDNLEQLNHAVQSMRSDTDLILIDSVGLNPWLATDMAFFADLKQHCNGVEPIVVIPAGLDSLETGDVAAQFARLGCSRFIATRLDVSGVYGNILNATANGLALTYYGMGPMPTDLFEAFSAEKLADLLMKTPLSRELLS
jgi:flagellar biosynthesis protein FlhF